MKCLPYLSLQIAGEGPQRAELEALASELDLINVEFLGQASRKELDGLISRSRFTVLPSHAMKLWEKAFSNPMRGDAPVVALGSGLTPGTGAGGRDRRYV